MEQKTTLRGSPEQSLLPGKGQVNVEKERQVLSATNRIDETSTSKRIKVLKLSPSVNATFDSSSGIVRLVHHFTGQSIVTTREELTDFIKLLNQ